MPKPPSLPRKKRGGQGGFASAVWGGLLHGHGLGQVTRLVHIVALGLGYMGGKDLQRHGGQQRLHEGRRLRDADNVVSVILDGGIALFRNHDGDGTAGADLLDIGNDLGVQGVAAARRRHDDEDRLAFLNQCNRAVLELAGGKALGVQVGDLLELQRALKSYRDCLLYTSPSPRDISGSRMPSSA